jgi:hypothetical protein
MLNQSNSISSITFFYPSRIIGGAEFLYIRLAKYITENTSIPVYVFDYKDGFLTDSLLYSSVNLVEYKDDESVIINNDTIVITPFCHMFKLNEFVVKPNSVRVFYWSIHPTHFTNFFLTRNWFLGKKEFDMLKDGFIELIKQNAMVFMDYPNYLENKVKLDLPFKEYELNYLPICCDLYEGPLHQYQNKDIINVCWLGRIATDKVTAIENFAWHLNSLDEKLKAKIKFTIIGNGEEEERLLRFMKNLDLNYEHKNTILGSELNTLLINEIDLGVAMGTSLLEFAKLRIPVVMVDIMDNSKLYKANKFRWLNETVGFSMGDIFKFNNDYKHSIQDVIESVSSETSYNEVAKLCYDYYKENHALTTIANKLIETASTSQVFLPDNNVNTIFNVMNPWYFNALKKLKTVLIK